jgi:hypothetical protein
MRLRHLFGVALFCGLALPALAQFPGPGSPAQSSSHRTDSVRFLFPEQISIPANKLSAVDLHFKVVDGMHINSHAPHSKLLIPTNLVVPEESGMTVSAVEFPAGADYSFSFSPSEKLSVYAGEFVLKAMILAQPGQHLLQALLRYQACDSNSCYPPKTIPVALDVFAK